MCLACPVPAPKTLYPPGRGENCSLCEKLSVLSIIGLTTIVMTTSHAAASCGPHAERICLMQGDQPISWLMFFTLGAGIVVAAGLFLNFLRSRHNREIAALALEGNGRGQGMAPSGALPELAGFLVVALIAMGLLTAGYQSHSSSHFAADTATPVPTAPSNRDRGTTVGAGVAGGPPGG